MDIGIVSVRYAKALLRFATENKEEQQVYAEMETLAGTFLKVQALQSALLNPVLTNDQKTELLASACVGNGDITQSTKRFIQLVTDKKRADLMMFIANAYMTLYRKSKGIIKGCLTVPTEISENVCKRLQQIIESKTSNQVEFEVRIDEDIKGGFILDYDTYRLDASLRTQLNELKRALKN